MLQQFYAKFDKTSTTSIHTTPYLSLCYTDLSA